jgi:hypothetical protein
MKNMLDMKKWLLAAAMVVGMQVSVSADEPAPDGEESTIEAKAGESPGKKAKKPDFPPFDEVVKDMEVKEGYLTLYFDKKEDKLLARIPGSVMGKNVHMSISISEGPTYANWMLTGGVLRFERMNKKVVVYGVDPRFVKPKDNPISDVIERTYTDSIVTSVGVVTESGGDTIINLADLMKKDPLGIMTSLYRGTRVDEDLSRWARFKTFPKNVEIGVRTALMSMRPGAGGTISTIHYSLSELPSNGYKPRMADERVGYFGTVQKDWSVAHDANTTFKRYINRWNLEKVDPSLDASPVKDPIVFYIEKTVPVYLRRYVREGIEAWNEAFERLGLLNAVQVRQQTDTNEFKDLDPEDVRYNFFRWMVSGRSFARGPSRVNPLTGQILDADIIMDDSMIRVWQSRYQLKGPRALSSYSDPLADAFFEAHPDWQITDRQTELFGPIESLSYGEDPGFEIADPSEILAKFDHDHAQCELGEGMLHQAVRAAMEAKQNGVDLPKEYIGQIVREVVMHEVGHTIGLRHNFKASSWKPLIEIMTPSAELKPNTASVMDYNPSHFAASEVEQGDFVTKVLGPYDFWAIEYGYRPFNSKDGDKSEEEMLSKIAFRSTEPALAYATDEDTSDFGPDPFVNRFDSGSDPLDYGKQMVGQCKRLMKDVETWAVEDGESYAELRNSFNTILGDYLSGTRFAARLIGGMDVTRVRKGQDGKAPYEVVPVEKQREALAFLGETVFQQEAFEFLIRPELINFLAAGRFMHWDSDQADRNVDYDLHDRILGIQQRVMTVAINPMTVNRIVDSELRVDSDKEAMTASELFDTMTGLIWSELKENNRGQWSDRKPRINSFRRNLQREYVNRLTSMVLSTPGRSMSADAGSIVRMELRDLSERIDGELKSNGSRLDTYTQAHLEDTKSRIDRALDAGYALNDGRQAGGQTIRIVIGQEDQE